MMPVDTIQRLLERNRTLLREVEQATQIVEDVREQCRDIRWQIDAAIEELRGDAP
jgi:hypothetical protein